jgi:Arc/MetJ family transcription regulator
MARTNIDLDESLVGEVMRRYRLHSKREAVHFALQRLVGDAMSLEEALAMEGSGWEGDLGAIRRNRLEGVWPS